MEGKDLAEQIAQMLQDVEALSQRANQTPDQPLEILTNTFEQLHIALEELQVANQELQQQNEELAAARHILEQERQRYTDLFEFAPDAYLVTTPEGVIQEANWAAAVLLNLPQKFLVGKPLISLVAEADRRQFRTGCLQFKAADQRQAWELELQPRHRSSLTAAISIAPVLAQQGLVALRWMLRDISAAKQAEAEIHSLNAKLEQRVQDRTAQLATANQLQSELLTREQTARSTAEAANQAKDEFLATLSHELRTPLNAMVGWASLLRSRDLDQATVSRALETIERNAKAQTKLIEDLLDLSRIVQGKLRVNVAEIYPAPTIQAAMDVMGPASDAKGITLKAALDPAVGPVLVDPDRLQQILWNLLTNGIKFTPEGGQVTVLLEQVTTATGLVAQIQVQDTGIGINPEFLPQVFDRFSQREQTSSRSYGGLGLGLAIVRHLVELQGGTVDVASPGEGQGAIFTVNLPLMTSQDNLLVTPASLDDNESADLSLQDLRVLVVDDHLDVREWLVVGLGEYGAQVTAVRSAAEIFEPITHDTAAGTILQQADILISDLAMSSEDGYALIRKVRTLHPAQGGQIPALALTASVTDGDRHKTLAAGFQLHLSKPCELTELATAIVTLAGQDHTTAD